MACEDCCSFCPFPEVGCTLQVDPRYRYLQRWILDCLTLRLITAEVADGCPRPVLMHLQTLVLEGLYVKGVACALDGRRIWFQWLFEDGARMQPRHLTYGFCDSPQKCQEGELRSPPSRF